jgi:hypothetical protein
MKTFKNLLIIAFTLFGSTAFAQTDKATTQRIVEAKTYTFVATTAMPLNIMDINKVFNKIPGNTQAGNINLSGTGYNLKITPDTLISYLPYYGRAFRASFNNDENGIKFTSTKFDYKMEKGRKKGWNVTMNTKDVKDNARMNLSINENGYANLSLVTNNKQSINYYGYLKEN